MRHLIKKAAAAAVVVFTGGRLFADSFSVDLNASTYSDVAHEGGQSTSASSSNSLGDVHSSDTVISGQVTATTAVEVDGGGIHMTFNAGRDGPQLPAPTDCNCGDGSIPSFAWNSVSLTFTVGDVDLNYNLSGSVFVTNADVLGSVILDQVVSFPDTTTFPYGSQPFSFSTSGHLTADQTYTLTYFSDLAQQVDAISGTAIADSGATLNGTLDLQFTVATPLPASSWGGLTLLAGAALIKLRRCMKAAADRR